MKNHLDVAAALFQEGRRILLCQRRYSDDFGGLWEFPGGKIETGETAASAVEREMAEELGIKCRCGELVGKFSDENDTLHIDVYLYRVESFSGTIQKLQCRDFKWLTYGEAARMELAPADRKILKFLREENGIR